MPLSLSLRHPSSSLSDCSQLLAPSPSPSPSLPLSFGSFGKCFLKSRPGRIVCLQQQQLWCLGVGKGCRRGQGLLLGVIAGRRYRVLSLSNRTTLKLFANGPQLCLFHSIKQLGRLFSSPPHNPSPSHPHPPTGNTLPGLQLLLFLTPPLRAMAQQSRYKYEGPAKPPLPGSFMAGLKSVVHLSHVPCPISHTPPHLQNCL